MCKYRPKNHLQYDRRGYASISGLLISVQCEGVLQGGIKGHRLTRTRRLLAIDETMTRDVPSTRLLEYSRYSTLS